MSILFKVVETTSTGKVTQEFTTAWEADSAHQKLVNRKVSVEMFAKNGNGFYLMTPADISELCAFLED